MNMHGLHMKYMKARNLTRGFTIIELIITLAIVSIGVIWAGNEALNNARLAVVRGAGANIKMIGEATQNYISTPANLPALYSQPTTAITIGTLTAAGSCGTGVQCLSASIATTNSWGSGYTILIRRLGGASPYQLEFLVVTNTAYITDGNTRLDLLGKVAGEIGTQLGFTTSFGGALRAQGNNGTWTALPANYPAIVAGAGSLPGGQLAYYGTQIGLPFDNTYLRLDGTNTPTGNINLGGNGLYGIGRGINAAGVTAPGSAGANDIVMSGNANIGGNATITGGATINGNTTMAGNLTMSGAAAQLSLTGGGSDIKMASLQTTGVSGGVALSTSSLTALAPRLVEVATQNVGNGTVVPTPSCPGGTASIFVMPSSAVMSVTGGTAGYLFSASGSGPWTIIAWDISTPGTCGGSNGVPANGATCLSNPNGAIARVFCQY